MKQQQWCQHWSALLQPQAYVVVKDGVEPNAALAVELQQYVKATLAPVKYPRWIDFVKELPKTATGKIQRYVLRNQLAAGAEASE